MIQHSPYFFQKNTCNASSITAGAPKVFWISQVASKPASIRNTIRFLLANSKVIYGDTSACILKAKTGKYKKKINKNVL